MRESLLSDSFQVAARILWAELQISRRFLHVMGTSLRKTGTSLQEVQAFLRILQTSFPMAGTSLQGTGTSL